MPTKREVRNALNHFLTHAKKGDIEWSIGHGSLTPDHITAEEWEAFSDALTTAIQAGELRKGWKTSATYALADLRWKHNGGEAYITFVRREWRWWNWVAPTDIAIKLSVSKAMAKDEIGDPLPPARA